MSILDKLTAIEIKADTRISEEDRKVCQAHQAAYENSREMLLYMRELWDVFVYEQQEIMSPVTDSTYVRERYCCIEGLSSRNISKKLEHLPELLITSIVNYFNDKYHVSVSEDNLKKIFIPSSPKYDWEQSRVDEYHEKMETMILRYEDILEQIFVQLGGRTFEERALDEIKEKCHKFVWTEYSSKPSYEVKNDTVQFTGYACSFDSFYRRSEWEIKDGMKNILRGLAHFETQQLDYIPKDISFLIGHESKYSSAYDFNFEKIKKIRMFKNHRVDVKFASKALANQFVEQYLGLVA